jgi:hypothetical protein
MDHMEKIVRGAIGAFVVGSIAALLISLGWAVTHPKVFLAPVAPSCVCGELQK